MRTHRARARGRAAGAAARRRRPGDLARGRRPAAPAATIGSSARTCSTTRCGSRSRAAGSPASRIRPRGHPSRSPASPRRAGSPRRPAPPAGRWSTTPAGRPASSPTRPYHANDFTVLAAFVAAGLGVAMVPGLALPAFGGPEVGIHPVADVPVTRRIFAAARRGGLERPAAAAMVAALRAAAQTAHAQRQVIRERRGVEDLDLARPPVGEEVVDVMAAEPHQPRHRRRGRVHVAAEQQRGAVRPLERGRRGAHQVGAALLRRMRRGVEVHDPADPRQRDPVHHAPFRPLRQLADPVLADRHPAHEDRVAAAAVRGDQVRVAPRERAPREEREVARGQRHPRARPAGRAEGARPPRRHLLEQRDVPVPGRDRAAELDEQRAPRRRVGTPVEQVPAQHEHGARRYRV